MSQYHFHPKHHKLYTPQQLQLLPYADLINSNQFDYVYQPNDDTFLMLSTLQHELSTFQSDSIICEIGSGSGIISANLNNWLRENNKLPLLHVSIDLNMDASMLSKSYYDKYSLNIQQVNTSTFNNIIFTEGSLGVKPNIVVFNPPYVPVEQQEIENQYKYLVSKLKHVRQRKECVRVDEQNLIAYSYMGGLDGLDITRKIISRINWNCCIYFIVMGYQGLSTIQDEINCRKVLHSLVKQKSFQVMQYHQFENQHLFVIKLILETQNK